MRDWQLQDAKNRFSEVVKCAREEGPALEFDALIKPRISFVDFLLSDTLGAEPWSDDLVDAINDRNTDAGRDVVF